MRAHGMRVSLFCIGWIAVWCVKTVTGGTGPDPAKWLLHQTGEAALLLLLATLAVSTFRRMTGGRLSLRWRRPIGIAAFVIALLHVLVYAIPYQGLSWQAIVDDLAERPYIWIGATAFVLLLPMALTSTNTMRRRVGAGWWQRIHRALYVIVPLVILHQGMAQKADMGKTLVFSAIAVCFLIERARFFLRVAVEK